VLQWSIVILGTPFHQEKSIFSVATLYYFGFKFDLFVSIIELGYLQCCLAVHLFVMFIVIGIRGGRCSLKRYFKNICANDICSTEQKIKKAKDVLGLFYLFIF